MRKIAAWIVFAVLIGVPVCGLVLLNVLATPTWSVFNNPKWVGWRDATIIIDVVLLCIPGACLLLLIGKLIVDLCGWATDQIRR